MLEHSTLSLGMRNCGLTISVDVINVLTQSAQFATVQAAVGMTETT
jgi:hypothetical protein